MTATQQNLAALSAYIPVDRRLAMAEGRALPLRTNGAALFADISGFTPLTAAQLKELGRKRGPEESTRQLNLVYDALITQVHLYRGAVIGFVGDAITCWFDGDNGTQATACALKLQEAMEQFKAITTPGGTIVSLTMKISVATGPARRFLVGTPHIQTIDALAGATLDQMAAAEQKAGSGEVVVAPEVIKNLGQKLVIAETRLDPANGAPFAVVTGIHDVPAPTPWPTLFPELSEEQIRPWLLPPVFHTLRRGVGEFLAEIRPTVALFVRFSGIDYDHDPQAEAKLDAYICWIQTILLKYEGYLLQLTIGDKGCFMYGSFGSLQSHDDDPARAVAAALDIQALPDELSFIGPVQIGINQGRMRAGAYGGHARRSYGSISGDVNIAARLMANAQPGQIMVSQEIARLVDPLYSLEDLGRIKVKGKDEPIPVALVLRRKQQVPDHWRNLFTAPLVGRETELAKMVAVLTTAQDDGHGQLVQIEGPAGIGKSHLIVEFAQPASQQGWQVVLGACQSISHNTPYFPWRQIFLSLFKLEGDSADQLVEQLERKVTAINPAWQIRLPLFGDLLGLQIADNDTTAAFEPQLRQEALFTFALDLLQHWAQRTPLLLILDDVHWADEASRALVMALARITRHHRLVLMVGQRPPMEHTQPTLPQLTALPGYHFINLNELSPAGVAALIAYRLQGPPSPLLVDLVTVQAHGNPFFVEELLDMLQEGQQLVRVDQAGWTLSAGFIETLRRGHYITRNKTDEWILNPSVSISMADLGLPDSIQQVVLARLDRLQEDQRFTLKVASVIGRVFDINLLAQSHPLEQDPARLLEQVENIKEREFVRLELPLPHPVYLFKHNITRDVAYENLLASQQQELHGAVARAIERMQPDEVNQLAHHYVRANIRDKALDYLDKAAHKAQQEYVNETALNYYDQALALENRWEWQRERIRVLHLLGRREAEAAALNQLAADPATPAFISNYHFSQYHEAIGDYDEAQAATEKALAEARRATHQLNQTRCLAQLGLIARRQGDYQAARNWYQQAVTDFDSQRDYAADEAKAMAQVLDGLGTVERQQGAFNTATEYYQRALDISQKMNDSVSEAGVLNSLGVTNFYLRNFTEAQHYYQQALEIRHTIGDRAGEGTTRFNLAQVSSEMGDYGLAKKYFFEALHIHKSTDNRWEEVNVWNSLGILYQELGEFKLSRSYLAEGIQITSEIGDEVGQAYLLANLGLVAYEEGDLTNAKSLLDEGVEIAQAHGERSLASAILNYLSMVHLALTQVSHSMADAHQSLTIRNELGLSVVIADNFATLAEAHLARQDISQATDYAKQALTILTDCKGEGPEFSQRDYFICYQVLGADGQNKEAQAALQSAFNHVIKRANKINDPALRQSFLENVAMNRQIMAAYKGAKNN